MRKLFYLLLMIFFVSCNSGSVEFIAIEGGTFLMGSKNGDEDELPIHSVTVSSFYMMKTEVTQELYEKVMGDNPSKIIGNKYPVTHVSWFDAITFCNKWSTSEGLMPCYKVTENGVTWNKDANGYRLPTEAEWEYAARGGIHKKNYEYSENSDGQPHKVATKEPNDLGLYDMSGNAGEWCWDWKDDYSNRAETNPCGPTLGDRKVLRSGSPYIYDYYCRIANREGLEPQERMVDFGCIDFRVVRKSK